MKKLLALVLAIIMMLSFVGCGGIKDSDIVGVWKALERVEENDSYVSKDFQFIFYDDGSVIHTFVNDYYNNYQDDKDLSFTGNWYIEDDKVYIDYNSSNTKSVFTFENDNGRLRLYAPKADGYWYEKVSE